MDPVANPFAPGAGTPPPELAGREKLRERVRIAVARTQRRHAAKGVLLVGLRGVGKTVLLDRMREDAETVGALTLGIEAPEERSLPALLAPQVRQALLDVSRMRRARELGQRGLRALASFVSALKMKYDDIEVGFDFDAEPGLADSGDLEFDLRSLLEAVGDAASAADKATVLFIDELQYVKEPELAALVAALHRTAQRRLPVLLVGAGLPQLRARIGKAKSYAERMFEFPEVGALEFAAARAAIAKPIAREGARIDADALRCIVAESQGYPYFLQEWGKHVWDVADNPPITARDVDSAAGQVIDALDESFFRVRFDRLTPTEKRYLRAMSALGPGPHRSGDIAVQLRRRVSSLGPVRAQLIAKGMISSPSHGDTAFTVPMFDEFMARIMPGDDWREAS